MSFFDQAKDKIQEFAGNNQDKVGDGIDKAAEFADDKTGGKHGDQIRQGADKLKENFGGGQEQGGQPQGGGEQGGQPGEQQWGNQQ
ncbi:antitoxin [Amycolatopsis rubida]|uniref:MT0933-like antitoxin protein n=1 Tax=Amycolatopsis rubida TaxID=112413 RepID=A0A1I6A341_9PSEU|nr:antitoxin [Amycolatopsis rubida]SFQ63023.1 MT0933-like antitoxin protein [Amycolatopsis rubida]